MQELDFEKFKEMQDKEKLMFSNRRPINEALAVGGTVGITSTLIATSPANASVADINTMMTAVQGVAAGAVAVLVVGIGVRLAVKQVNRILTKG
jgi:hypothetical protein